MKHALAALLIAICCGWYVNANFVRLWPAIDGNPSDFAHHYEAGRQIMAGKSPYVDADYDYPPLAALAATALTVTDYVTARKTWFVLSHALLLIAGWLTWRASGRDWSAACCVAAVWALGGAAAENLMLGQLGPLLVVLLAIAYTGGPMAGASAIAIGFGLKFIPGVLAIPLGLARSRRALLGCVAMAVASVAIPWGIVDCCLVGPKSPPSAQFWMGTPAILSWSLPSTAMRMLDPPTPGVELPGNWLHGNEPMSLVLPATRRFLSVAIAAITLLGGVLTLGRACRWRLDRQQLPWAMAATVSLALAAAPICWTHYQIMQYPGIALLLAVAIHHGKWVTAGSALAFGALLYPLPVAVLRSYYEQYGAWTAASPGTLYVWTSVAPVACLGLFALYLAQMKAANMRTTAP